jgi:chitinase
MPVRVLIAAFCSIAAFACAPAPRISLPARPSPPVVIAYVFPGERPIDPAAIAADQLTHINYAFANIVAGEWVEGHPGDAANLDVLRTLRQAHPHLRLLVSVGGWTWSKGFSDMAATAAGRRRFVRSAISFARRHDLDGLDVDWEYPGLPGDGNPHRPEDRGNFTSLMRELRAALDEEGRDRGRHLLLTCAVGAFPRFLAHTEMDKVAAAVDFVNLMTYDFRVPEADTETGHHANLFPQPADRKGLSADRAVRDFHAAGVPLGRLVLGVPFYGRAWAVVPSSGNGLYQPGRPLATRLDTSPPAVAQLLASGDGWRREWDAVAQAPFLWNPAKRIFASIEDPESLAIKARYVREHGLGGMMFWQYYSDPSGVLLSTIARELRATY